MTEDEIQRLVTETAETASKKAVEETFLALGLDISTPDAVIARQLDFRHMQRSRAVSDLVGTYGLSAIVTIVVGATIAMLWSGLLDVFRK